MGFVSEPQNVELRNIEFRSSCCGFASAIQDSLFDIHYFKRFWPQPPGEQSTAPKRRGFGLPRKAGRRRC
jgi:hypothetical protein